LPFEACATSVLAARLSRINLIFVYDKSGSMGDPAEGGDPKTKWIPLENGMEAFFADPASQWMSASLELFPAPGDLATTCAYAYANPNVALEPLSANNDVLATIKATMPQGGTPTLQALEGGIAYAQSVVASDPEDKTVVVLVTDGEPSFYVDGGLEPGCTDNDLTHVEAAAASAFAASPPLPTYVIGVGTDIDTQNANAIAAAGGTQQAFMVSVTDPTTTSSQLVAALGAIRTQTVSCTLALPAPPAGQLLDPNKVNVGFQPSGGAPTVIAEDPACTGGVGWHYDVPTGPTSVELCPSTCDAVRAGGGSVSFAFGCATAVITR